MRQGRARHGGARAFIANGQQGVTYKPDTWHHGLTTLDQPGRFAVFMWRAGTKDEEFVPGGAVHHQDSLTACVNG